MYPETYIALKQALKDAGFEGQQHSRIVAIVSAWEAAIETHGDLEKIEVYDESGVLTLNAFDRSGWSGKVLNDE